MLLHQQPEEGAKEPFVKTENNHFMGLTQASNLTAKQLN